MIPFVGSEVAISGGIRVYVVQEQAWINVLLNIGSAGFALLGIVLQMP